MPTSSSSSSAKEEAECCRCPSQLGPHWWWWLLLMMLLPPPAPLALTAPPRRRAEERETPVDATDGAARTATLFVPLPRLPLHHQCWPAQALQAMPPVTRAGGASLERRRLAPQQLRLRQPLWQSLRQRLRLRLGPLLRSQEVLLVLLGRFRAQLPLLLGGADR